MKIIQWRFHWSYTSNKICSLVWRNYISPAYIYTNIINIMSLCNLEVHATSGDGRASMSWVQVKRLATWSARVSSGYSTHTNVREGEKQNERDRGWLHYVMCLTSHICQRLSIHICIWETIYMYIYMWNEHVSRCNYIPCRQFSHCSSKFSLRVSTCTT